MRITANSVSLKTPKQEPCNPICATCTHNCKQAAYAQVIFCRKYPRDRQALPTKWRVKKE